MSGEREVQVGWWWPGDRTLNIVRPTDDHAHWLAAGWQPVYVKVPDPDPERCPTCGSDNPGVEIMPAHIESEDQLLGFLCGEGRCPDPWHSTAAPDVSASTDQ